MEYVLHTAKELCFISGQNSNIRRENLIIKLLRKLSPTEGKYIIRFLKNNYKIGVAEKLF